MSVNYNILNKINDKISSSIYLIKKEKLDIMIGYGEIDNNMLFLRDNNIDKYKIKKILMEVWMEDFEGTGLVNNQYIYFYINGYIDIKKYLKDINFNDYQSSYYDMCNYDSRYSQPYDEKKAIIYERCFIDLISKEDQEKIVEEIFESINLDDFIKTLVEKGEATMEEIFQGKYTLQEIKMEELYNEELFTK